MKTNALTQAAAIVARVSFDPDDETTPWRLFFFEGRPPRFTAAVHLRSGPHTDHALRKAQLLRAYEYDEPGGVVYCKVLTKAAVSALAEHEWNHFERNFERAIATVRRTIAADPDVLARWFLAKAAQVRAELDRLEVEEIDRN